VLRTPYHYVVLLIFLKHYADVVYKRIYVIV